MIKKLNTWMILLLKSVKIIKFIKLFKFAKPMVTIISITLSAGLYSAAYGWIVGIGLVVLIFVHEMGHVMAMNREGFKTSGPVFIPFLGAALFAPKNMTRRQEAFIGISGPIIGSLGALLMLGLYFVTGLKWMLMLAYLGIFINLFNMIPISPLDGGRVTQAVGKWFQVVGLLMLLLVSIAMRQPGILVVWVIVLFDIRSLKIKTRFILACLAELSMILMFSFGIGMIEGSFWPTLFDILIGGMYLWFMKLSINQGMSLEDEETRFDLPVRDKRKWLIVWVLTTVLLTGILVGLIPLISSH